MATIGDSLTAGQIKPDWIAALEPAAYLLDRLTGDQRRQLAHILMGPIDFVDHGLFPSGAAARELFSEFFAATTRPWAGSAAEAPRPDQPAAGRNATLTTREEQRLFLRLNYARYRMAALVERFAGRRLPTGVVRELLWWHEQTQTTRDEIVRANMPLVLAMAKRTRLGNVDYMELISEGNMALLRSVEKFDCGRGFKFSTYACRAILKSFSRVAMKSSRYRGRFPTEFDPTLEKSSYQEEVREHVEADCVDELRGIIKENTAALNDVEVKVLRARFALGRVDGLDGEGPKTLEQVGLLIGVTKERVRQIQNRALEKLRIKLQEDFLAA